MQPNEFKFVVIRRRSKTGGYTGSETHGVKTSDCKFDIGGFDIITSAIRFSVFNHDVIYKPEIKSVNVLVQGDVIGADLYAVESDLSTAVVHQGLLKPGEWGIIRVVHSEHPKRRHQRDNHYLAGNDAADKDRT